MSANTKIEWTDSTFNFWEGCQKVGPGCDHCYAETRNARFGGGVAINWGPGAPRRLTSVKNRNLPHRWNREHEAFKAEHGRRQRVFCSSLSDVFDNAVDPAWRADLFAIMEACPNLDWLVLTKRVGNVAKMVPPAWMTPGGWPAQVRIGATIVNQEEADRDIPKLLALPCPNFLSMEPLLGPVDLRSIRRPELGDGREYAGADVLADANRPLRGCIDWVIVGGESGPGARPMHPDWTRSLRDQCEAAGVPYLFKQWGEWKHAVPQRAETPGRYALAPRTFDGPIVQIDHYPRQFSAFGSTVLERVGKEAAGRMLDGRTHDGFPA